MCLKSLWVKRGPTRRRMADAAALPLPGRLAVAAAVAVGLWWSGGPGTVQCQCACAGEQTTLVLDLLGRQLERCGPEQLRQALPAPCAEVSGCFAAPLSAFLGGLALGVGATAAACAIQRHQRRKELAELISPSGSEPARGGSLRVPKEPARAPAATPTALPPASGALVVDTRAPSAGLLAARRALQA